MAWSAALVAATPVWAGAFATGEVVVVEDTTGAQHDPQAVSPLLGLATTLCQFASNGLYSFKPDDYDGVIMFTTHPMNTMELGIQNVMRGNIVRQTAHGISPQSFISLAAPATYGSPAKLSQCVYMGSLGQLPPNPDDQVNTLFGGFIPLPMGITGAELMGHEYGHHWLVWAEYDKADGKGHQALFRGDEANTSTDPNAAPSPNGHYSHYADSHSVMYGSFITPMGNGQFQLKGGVRKYGELDQYLMGLRSPSEVSPMLVVDDGSHRGAAVQPLWRTSSASVSGTAVNVDVQDVVRALGARSPAYPSAQSCFRVAFVLVTHQGHTATAAEIAKVDTYRQRWESWFNFATDGRGTMDTALGGGLGRCTPGFDGGVPPPADAGVAEPDAGTADLDGGASEPVDGGGEPEFDGGEPMAEPDAGQPARPPTRDETRVDLGPTKVRPGCGCTGAAGGLELAALLSAALRARRRSRG